MMTERLKIMRENRSFSHAQVAEYLGITRQAYANYENGERDIKAETLRKLVVFYHTSADYLLGVTDEPSPSHASNMEQPYDSLVEITACIRTLGRKDMGLFNIEKWKNLSPEDAEMIERHFEMVVEIAEKRKK